MSSLVIYPGGEQVGNVPHTAPAPEWHIILYQIYCQILLSKKITSSYLYKYYTYNTHVLSKNAKSSFHWNTRFNLPESEIILKIK